MTVADLDILVFHAADVSTFDSEWRDISIKIVDIKHLGMLGK